jgi:hypothetical protein
MPFYHGTDGAFAWFYLHGTVTDADWNQYLETIEHGMAENTTTVSLTIAYQATLPTPIQRRRLADLVSREAMRQDLSLKALAFATDSSLARGALTAINWLVKKPFPEKVFGNPVKAIEWLATITPGLNARAAWARIGSRLPEAQRWPIG